jgi:hypothetical protein
VNLSSVVHDTKAQSATAGLSVVALFGTVHHHFDQVQGIEEALTRPLKFDTASILFARDQQDWLLRPFCHAFDSAKVHLFEDIRHIPVPA